MRFSLLNLLLPDTCVLCQSTVEHRHDHLCCASCWASLPRNTNACRHCARALNEGNICGSCLITPLSTGIAVVPLIYAGEAITLVSALKFRNSTRAARTLARTILTGVQAAYGAGRARPNVIVPTPMAWRRQFIRGYNQSARLASDLAKALGIPTRALLKRGYGPTQHGRSRAARQSLPLSTFEFVGEPPQHIALVDDVMTTGATMKAMASICARAGVRRVDLWAACRTPE